MKPKLFSFEEHDKTGKRLAEIQNFFFELQERMSIASYAKEFPSIIQVIKKLTRLQHFLDDRCLNEYSGHEAASLYFNQKDHNETPG